MFELLELSEPAALAFGFWFWVFSPRYRMQIGTQWSKAGPGRRLVLMVEYVVAAGVGLGIPVLILLLLT